MSDYTKLLITMKKSKSIDEVISNLNKFADFDLLYISVFFIILLRGYYDKFSMINYDLMIYDSKQNIIKKINKYDEESIYKYTIDKNIVIFLKHIDTKQCILFDYIYRKFNYDIYYVSDYINMEYNMEYNMYYFDIYSQKSNNKNNNKRIIHKNNHEKIIDKNILHKSFLKFKSNFYWIKLKNNKKYIIYKLNVNIKFIALIEILKLNNSIMYTCYKEILATSKRHPPAKNDNKFIYGKVIEKCLGSAFTQIGFKCIDLDNKHKHGSEYKNDIELLGINISIKAKLNKGGDIILINKKSKVEHKIDMNTIVCVINEGMLYFIPFNIIDEKHIKNDAGTISYKGSVFKLINNEFNQYIYKFPELCEEDKQKIENIQEYINIHEHLYNNIKNLFA